MSIEALFKLSQMLNKVLGIAACVSNVESVSSLNCLQARHPKKCCINGSYEAGATFFHLKSTGNISYE